MCIRDRGKEVSWHEPAGTGRRNRYQYAEPVSYTHLDVYKRQEIKPFVELCPLTRIQKEQAGQRK